MTHTARAVMIGESRCNGAQAQIVTNPPSWSRRSNRPVWAWAAAGIGLLLLAYTAMRAHRVAFTHDECGTFFTYVTASFWDIITFHVVDANNHLLNSLLARVCYLLFGDHPLHLRLPNLCAHAVYLVFALRAVRLVAPHPLVGLAAFLLLSANPYLLDFFGLARGYGLSVAFVMASAYHAGRHALSGLRADVWRASIWGGLAVLGNLTALPAWVAIALVSNAWWIKDLAASPRRSGGFTVAWIACNVPFLVVGSALSVVLGWSSYRLGRAHAFYVGGKTGFWHDTVLGLADATLYEPAPAFAVLGAAWAGVLAFVLAASALPAETVRGPPSRDVRSGSCGGRCSR